MSTMRMVKSILMLIPLLTMSTSTVESSEYTLIDLGTLGGPESEARGISDNRQVTGISHVTNTVRHAFVWDEVKGMRDLGTLGGTDSGGIAINNYGEVGGWSDFDGDTPFHAFHHDGTVMHDLGTLGGDFSIVFSMNDNGQLVGRASLKEGYHAFLYDNDLMHDLGTLGGSGSMAYGINGQGHIVGGSLIAGDTANHAFVWDSSNGMQSIGTLGGSSSRALSINNFGQVTGTSQYLPTNNEYHVFLWDEVNGMQDLGGLDGGGGTGVAINDRAQITGESDGRAFIWDRESGMRDLCFVTKCTDKGWAVLTMGRGINNHGDIAGEGVIGGVKHAFLAVAAGDVTIPIDLSGTIKTPAGQDICAMVLASGQYMFSCNPTGVFSLTGLPREKDGTVKRQIYADGFFPKIDILPGSTNDAVIMTRSGVCPKYNALYDPAFVPNSAGRRINIAGKVLLQDSETPICAMVLANGKYMFTCDGTGSYLLKIPLDNNGQYKLQVYADGFAPTIQKFDEFQTTNTVRMARASECQ